MCYGLYWDDTLAHLESALYAMIIFKSTVTLSSACHNFDEGTVYISISICKQETKESGLWLSEFSKIDVYGRIKLNKSETLTKFILSI